MKNRSNAEAVPRRGMMDYHTTWIRVLEAFQIRLASIPTTAVNSTPSLHRG